MTISLDELRLEKPVFSVGAYLRPDVKDKLAELKCICPEYAPNIGNPRVKINPDAMKRACLLPENRERTEAVLDRILHRNYSEQVFNQLVEITDQAGAWSVGFPPWATAYVMLRFANFYNFKQKDGNYRSVGFRAFFEEDKKRYGPVVKDPHAPPKVLWLMPVDYITGNPVNEYFRFRISESAADKIWAPRKNQMSFWPLIPETEISQPKPIHPQIRGAQRPDDAGLPKLDK